MDDFVGVKWWTPPPTFSDIKLSDHKTDKTIPEGKNGKVLLDWCSEEIVRNCVIPGVEPIAPALRVRTKGALAILYIGSCFFDICSYIYNIKYADISI